MYHKLNLLHVLKVNIIALFGLTCALYYKVDTLETLRKKKAAEEEKRRRRERRRRRDRRGDVT